MVDACVVLVGGGVSRHGLACKKMRLQGYLARVWRAHAHVQEAPDESRTAAAASRQIERKMGGGAAASRRYIYIYRERERCSMRGEIRRVLVAPGPGLESVLVPVGRLDPMLAASRIRIQGTSLIRKRTPLGPYRRPMPRVLGGGRFLMSEVPL